MRRPNILITLTTLCMLFTAFSARAYRYDYDSVPGDPIKAKMYTLPNGLRIYMSVNKDKPRIQTNIAVRVGGKNDPAETTGLAHYFEHLMFKGTPEFGTSDYATEKPLLDKIEQLFETYRHTTDSTARAAIYHEIDSISYLASTIAIPNEYDKLMSAIGSSGTNAYTSYDETCYVENIPANQLDNWARIQAGRFKNPVLRGFHTELETIYEEKNMSLTKDGRKVWEKLNALLYPNHPYGTQTVLGTQEHLKNPSITNVKNYHAKWYVPNNMAVVLSGDFDPDNAVDIIAKYFGDMKPADHLDYLQYEPLGPLTEPVSADVIGNESESVYLAWRFPGGGDKDIETLNVLDYVMTNGKAGLIDLNINQKQLTLGAGSYVSDMADYSAWVMYGTPKEGQTLEEVRSLLLGELAKLRAGDFNESLIPATINNFKRQEQEGIESTDNRVGMMVESFIYGYPWEQSVTALDRQSKLTKADIVAFANKYLSPENFVTIYKRQGTDPNIVKMPKPDLTPIATNRDMASQYLIDVQNSVVTPIEPSFVDFEKDLTYATTKSGMPIYYKHNDTNDIFSLIYVFETGTEADRLLNYGADYITLLGTPDMTAEQIKNRFYELACNYYISVGARRSYIVLSGLSENMPQAMELMENVLDNAVPDKSVYDDYAGRVLKSRADRKGNQNSNLNALYTYAFYGPEYVARNLTNDEVTNLNPADLTASVKKLDDYKYRVIYYGPMSEQEVIDNIAAHHTTASTLVDAPTGKHFVELPTPETVIYIAPYDSNQLYMYMNSNNNEKFDPAIEPLRRMYNEYFNGNMSSIVFQEMRESRSLAYSASAGYSGVGRADEPYTYYAFIATQNDKMMDAINAFYDIINNMPQSEGAYKLAKDGFESWIRTRRVIKDDVAWSLISAQDLGYTADPNIALYDAIKGITLDDVNAFQQQKVKDRTYAICILGRVEDLDLDTLGKMGKIVMLTPEQTFGY